MASYPPRHRAGAPVDHAAAIEDLYVTRGFATAVWTHAIYDVWVLVLR